MTDFFLVYRCYIAEFLGFATDELSDGQQRNSIEVQRNCVCYVSDVARKGHGGNCPPPQKKKLPSCPQTNSLENLFDFISD